MINLLIQKWKKQIKVNNLYRIPSQYKGTYHLPIKIGNLFLFLRFPCQLSSLIRPSIKCRWLTIGERKNWFSPHVNCKITGQSFFFRETARRHKFSSKTCAAKFCTCGFLQHHATKYRKSQAKSKNQFVHLKEINYLCKCKWYSFFPNDSIYILFMKFIISYKNLCLYSETYIVIA